MPIRTQQTIGNSASSQYKDEHWAKYHELAAPIARGRHDNVLASTMKAVPELDGRLGLRKPFPLVNWCVANLV